MKKALLILICVSMLSACSKGEEDLYSYTFSKNSKVTSESFEGSYMRHGKVVRGANLVFEYVFVKDDVENIADDEYSEFIYFEIDPSLDEFNYVDEELNTINTVFTQSCFCAFFEEEKNVAPTGSISGKKISETQWDITIDVIFYGDEARNINNRFQLKD
ncbi:hypothetical protein [Maribacter sp. 2308TA10-17]|uniref:hypothetical protein n=1 Tax=Maribacter sp. 2308TA10-17 TaxID=3386276 RepID=UPI0039BCDBA3